MKKKAKLKTLAVSALIALATLGVGAGGTFALFTDSAETKVNVTAGTVDIESAIAITAATSLNADDATTVADNKQSATYVNGGSAVVGTTGTVTLSNWTPGDTVTLSASPTNNSNVKTKVRLKVVMTGDLASALVVECFDGEERTLAMTGKRTVVSDWAVVDAGAEITGHSLKISFPDHDGGEVLFDSTNKDNQYQGKEATIQIFYEAVQANAKLDATLEGINSKLATEEIVDGEMNHTMYDALQDLSSEQVTAIRERDYVWSQELDEFFDFTTTAPEEAYKYFKMYGSLAEATEDYSIFADDATWDATVALNGRGFDAGDATGITAINYTNTTGSAREVVIRSNSGTLTIDAATDTVHHYGDAEVVNLSAVSDHSYYENGAVSQVNIKKGRLVLTDHEDASIGTVYLQATEDAYDDIIIATQEGTKLPELIARDNVSLPTGTDTKKVVTIQSNVNKNGANPDKVETINLYPTAGDKGNDVYEATNGYNVSDLGLLVVEASSMEAKAQAAEQIADAEVAEKVNESKATFEVYNQGDMDAAIQQQAKHITIKNDFTADHAFILDFNTIIDGEKHILTSSGNRVFRIAGDNRNIIFRNFEMNSTYSGSDSRVISIDSKYDTINLKIDGCSMKCDYYALNITGANGSGSKNISIDIFNSTLEGYAAINNHASSSFIKVSNSVLIGNNKFSAGDSNSFATIVFDGGNYEFEGSYTFGNKIIVNNSTLRQITKTTNYQCVFSSQYGNISSEAHFNNCNIEHEGDNAQYFNYGYKSSNNVKIYIDGELYYEGIEE